MRSIRHTLAAILVVTLLASTAGVVPGAGAQTIESKQAEAARVAEELDQLRIQASQLDEAYHQAVMAIEENQREILAAEARIAELEDELGEHRSRVEQYAVQAYVGGDGQPDFDTVITSSEPNEIGRKVTYLSAATGDRQDLLDQLGGAQATLDAELDRLRDAMDDAERLEQEASESLTGAQQAIADEEALYARVQGELADLVAAEEARRAAETRRRAEEQARREAEAARAAAPPAAPAPRVIDDTNDDPPPAPPTTEAAAPTTEAQAPTTDPAPPATGAPDPAPTPPPAPGGATAGAAAAVAAAYSQLGVPYVWGGGSPSTGFDCSGFTAWAWGQAGRSLPHSAAAQAGMVRRLPLGELLPGDLVFYGWGHIHHVAMYVGGGQIVHAPGSGRHVRVDSIYYWDELHYAGRL